MAFGLIGNAMKPADLAARARRQTLAPMMDAPATDAPPTTAVQPMKALEPAASAPSPAAPYGGKTGAALARDPAYIESQIHKGWNQRFGTNAPPEEVSKWTRYALMGDTYSDRGKRVGWNDYLYDRLVTPGHEGSSPVDPGMETLVGYATGPDAPVSGASLDSGPSAASQDDRLLSSVLAQLQGQQAPGAVSSAMPEDGGASAVLRERDGLRRRARRDVYRGI